MTNNPHSVLYLDTAGWLIIPVKYCLQSDL